MNTDNLSGPFALLILLNVCHFLADYTWLSTPWMLKAKSKGKPLFPIFCHALNHASLMGTVIFFWLPNDKYRLVTMFPLFLLQLFSHWGIDVLKGRFNVWFPELASPAKVKHWIIFGGDQLLHQIVIILMAYYATTR